MRDLSALEVAELTWGVSWLFALATVPSVLVQRMGRPTSALAWSLALFAFPPGALFAWWLFGRSHLERPRRKRRFAARKIAPRLASARPREAPPSQPPRTELLSIVNLPDELRDGVFPPSSGNRARVLFGAEATYAAWEEAIKGARSHVHALFYIWNDDDTGRRFRDLLAKKAREGVEVRVLVDDVGAPEWRRGFGKPLIDAGGKAASFMPVNLLTRSPSINFRNHRKVLVVDGERGFIGGINVGDEYLTWNDLCLELRGAAVDQLQEVFVDDWFFTTGDDIAQPDYFGRWADAPPSSPTPLEIGVWCETIASGPTQRLNAMREMLFVALAAVKRRLFIMTPYFVPDQAMMLSLRAAIYRGVDVRVMVPAISDVPIVRRATRAFYPDLVAVGIKVLEYEGMLHAKAIVLDDELVLIGSANIDARSFKLNFEASCFVASAPLNRQLADRFEENSTRCREVTAESCNHDRWGERLLDAAAHVCAPLL